MAVPYVLFPNMHVPILLVPVVLVVLLTLSALHTGEDVLECYLFPKNIDNIATKEKYSRSHFF